MHDNITEMFILVFEWVENIVGKGENARNQYFFLFFHCFQMLSSSWSL